MTIETIQDTPPLTNGHNTWYTSGQVKEKYGFLPPHIATLGRTKRVTRRMGVEGYYEYLKHSIDEYLAKRKPQKSSTSSTHKGRDSGAEWITSPEARSLLTIYPASAITAASKALSNAFKRGQLERRGSGSSVEYRRSDVIRLNKTHQTRAATQGIIKPKAAAKPAKETAKSLAVDATPPVSARSYNQAWWATVEELKAKKFLTLDIFWVMVKERFG